MRKSWAIATTTGLALASTLLIPATALAFGGRTGQTITVAKNEVHQGTLYAAGGTLTIDGEVKGDLVCAGSDITVNGIVDGDVLCAGQNITINGKVTGDVRVAGQTLTVNGTVGHNVNAAGSALTVGDKAQLGEDLAFLGATETVNGPVAREIYGSMADLSLNSTVGDNVTVWPTSITLGSAAKIKGDFSYTADGTLAVDQAKVGGKINFHETPKVTKSPRQQVTDWLSYFVYWLVAVLLIALALVWLAPRAVTAVSDTMRSKVGPSLGWGALTVLAGPVLVIALLITNIAAPLGLITLGAWGLALCLCGSLAGITVGRFLLEKLKWHADSLPLAALVGVATAMAAFALPTVGGLLSFVAALWAMGGIILAWKANH